MNKMKRLTGRKIASGSCGILCIWFCKGAGHGTEKNTLTLTLDKAPWKLHWMRIRQ